MRVQSDKTRHHLLAIARPFQLLDRFFAEYFQEAERFGRARIEELLDEARSTIAGSQNQRPDQDESDNSVVLGDLGHFCEDVSQSRSQARRDRPKFKITNGSSDDMLSTYKTRSRFHTGSLS